MNVERMETLAAKLDEIEHHERAVVEFGEDPGPDHFDMMVWLEQARDEDGNCGTVGCVAGWAIRLFEEPDDDPEDRSFHDEASRHKTWGRRTWCDRAGDVLDMTLHQAVCLFMPSMRGDRYRRLTAKDASEAVRRAAAGDAPSRWWDHAAERMAREDEGGA